MVVQYKCSNCGADMAFDSKSGMLHCDSCDNYEKIESEPTLEEETEDSYESGPHKAFDGKEATEYNCKNCGAVLITDNDTTATTCTFCGSPVVLSDRLSGSLAPAKLIPFTINKEQAMKAFRSWCRGGLLTPKGFMTADRIKSITGLYVPFWLYDLNGLGEVDATCTRVRKYTRGDYIYTDTSYYHVYRKVDLNYLKIPADASAKLDDELMDKLEPFDYSLLKDFNMPYLAGYLAEKYNYDDKELFPRVKVRVRKYVNQYIRSTISGYSTTVYNRETINIRNKDADYVLFPIWIVCYNYKKKDYIFAMNGQTGKIVGKPPLSGKKMFTWFAGVSAGTFALISIISFIAGRFV
jgi:DNA-directed RNA polymerase subunit RPC12/RpoP